MQVRMREQLGDEPRLADSGLALDDGEGGRARCRLEQDFELTFAPDQNRGAEAR
jgi:hypothetical protein